jgi:hypothetical protein
MINNLTLFDDDRMSLVFDGNIPAAELILNIILKKEDIEVVNVAGQKELENPLVAGRNIRLDILVRDSSGKIYNVEVQQKLSRSQIK